ncbi:hypothetical protein F5Y16DRAFT_386325 [Xylariaceae sp. FL0255]|nr:hypothetical protein F5Y16DRAFT_386325 [Xylariaceae sp. FL0255]
MVISDVKYVDEVKWVPEQRMSFWRHIDRVCAQTLNRVLENFVDTYQTVYFEPDWRPRYHR